MPTEERGTPLLSRFDVFRYEHDGSSVENSIIKTMTEQKRPDGNMPASSMPEHIDAAPGETARLGKLTHERNIRPVVEAGYTGFATLPPVRYNQLAPSFAISGRAMTGDDGCESILSLGKDASDTMCQ